MNPPKFLHLVPCALEGDLAAAYNAAVQAVNPAVEWLLITDASVMFLTPHYGQLISRIIDQHSEAGLITCVANDIGAPGHRAKEVPAQTADLRRLRRVAVARAQRHGLAASRIDPSCSGFLMLFRRSVWQKVGGLKGGGMFGADSRFSSEIAAAGLPIIRMDGLLAVHFHRLDCLHASPTEAHQQGVAINRTWIINQFFAVRGYRS